MKILHIGKINFKVIELILKYKKFNIKSKPKFTVFILWLKIIEFIPKDWVVVAAKKKKKKLWGEFEFSAWLQVIGKI